MGKRLESSLLTFPDFFPPRFLFGKPLLRTLYLESIFVNV
jgi:hypothetical protein